MEAWQQPLSREIDDGGKRRVGQMGWRGQGRARGGARGREVHIYRTMGGAAERGVVTGMMYLKGQYYSGGDNLLHTCALVRSCSCSCSYYA